MTTTRTGLLRGPTPSPARLIATTFAGGIISGTLLLLLPQAQAPGAQVSFLDALFTATSALCITGLSVVDIGTTFNWFGQVIVMLLIKVGGLGIVTFGALFAIAMRRRVGYQQRLGLQNQMRTFEVGGVVKLLRKILLIAVSAELVGALLLWAPFARHEGSVARGAFQGLFHAISAFNNAGFSLYSDNLRGFVSDAYVNLVVATLVILGGLGFFVTLTVVARLRLGRKARLTLHTRIVLLATGLLLVSGFVAVLAMEWNNPGTLGPLTPFGKALAAFFQSVTPRTAGFETVPYEHFHSATLMFTMLLMFIGGSPGSTAGGIKTVTFVVMVGSAWSQARGRGELTLFGRTISSRNAVQASAVALFGVLLVGAAITVLLVTEPHLPFERTAFEAVSAFGTVGLSAGVTPLLSDSGRVVIILLMYLGRIGPLTLATALARNVTNDEVEYPHEEVLVG
ncbi:MAG TPA: TrkH family potassium uptake protein [Trueperaceae bacterium]|nr:TrkH family potassium uptake protein [Trueperaceae bacterium]